METIKDGDLDDSDGFCVDCVGEMGQELWGRADS